MYQVINNLPIDYDFQSKTKEELKLYAKWFEENKESRLQELIKAVKLQKVMKIGKLTTAQNL